MAFLLQVMKARSSAFSADLAGGLFGPQIHQHQVIVGAAGDDIEPLLFQGLGQGAGILDHHSSHRS